MSLDDILLLKLFAASENVSVVYYDNAKCYTVSVPAFLLDDRYDPFAEPTEMLKVFINCSYKMQMGITFLHCQIIREDSDEFAENTLVPMDTKRRNKRQNELMSLINTCARRIIIQEMSHNKFAITSAINAANNGKQYS